MPLLRPDPHRPEGTPDEITLETVVVSLIPMKERAEQFDNTEDHRYAKALLGLIAQHRRVLAKYEAAVQKAHDRVAPKPRKGPIVRGPIRG